MRVEIIAPDAVAAAADCTVRALLVNDSYEPVVVSRNAFVGPHLKGPHTVEAVEPTFGGPEETLTLQPFTFYGRERSVSLAPGENEVVAAYRDGAEEAAASARIVVEQG
jgi:hypothetical protein